MKKNPSGKFSGKTSNKPAAGIPRRVFLAGGGVVAALAAAGWFSIKGHWEKIAPVTNGGDLPRRGESRPVLLPARFRGAVRRAYQAAQELPDLFDKLFCYCYCDRSFGHKSLLSCYATEHGAG